MPGTRYLVGLISSTSENSSFRVIVLVQRPLLNINEFVIDFFLRPGQREIQFLTEFVRSCSWVCTVVGGVEHADEALGWGALEQQKVLPV